VKKYHHLEGADYMTSDQFAATIASFGLVFSLIGLATIIFAVIIWWRIFSKAGFSGALSLLMFVPIANLIMIIILAFAEWPIQAELTQLRMMRNQQFPQNQPVPQNPQYPQNPPNPQYRG
jgi:uncharacterized membrane protein YhaH (DUF805 family)